MSDLVFILLFGASISFLSMFLLLIIEALTNKTLRWCGKCKRVRIATVITKTHSNAYFETEYFTTITGNCGHVVGFDIYNPHDLKNLIGD